jgi:hypothetical protein
MAARTAEGLQRATQAALAAAEAGDLDALAEALEARARAIAAGEAPTLEILAAGDRLRELLVALRERLHAGSAQLARAAAQLGSGLRHPGHIDCRG